MPRSRSESSKHSVASQMLAFLLSFATLAGPLSTGAILAPLAAAARASHLRLLPAAIPPEPPAAPEPQPTPIPPDDTGENKKWGEITIAQPKIWQYERVNSLLDGLLRDVQGISTSDLTALDPNASNGAAVKFVQSMLEIGVQYNQGAAVTNKIALQNYATQQSVASAQIQANTAYLQQLNNQRTTLSNQLTDAMAQNTVLQNQLATTQLDPTSTDYKALAARQQAAAGEVTSLQSELSSVNSQITSASTTTLPAAPTLTSTTGGSAPESANTFGSFLGNLPPDLTKNVVSQLQSPSLPATKRMDNFITLLYERLAREISVLQDDVMRDPENVPFLVQFDVGLYPSKDAKNRVGVVEFTMDCDGCKVYSIYPGQSSYNLANYEGTSKRYSLWGALSTLVGFGVSADYRRQTDTLHGDLVQSVYMSGFQEGAESRDRTGTWRAQRFGWYYGTSPFEQLVTPGMRSTFAIVSIPRSRLKSCMEDPPEPEGVHRKEPHSAWIPGVYWNCDAFKSLQGRTDQLHATTVSLKMKAHGDWVPRNDPQSYWRSFSNIGLGSNAHGITRDLRVDIPGTDSIRLTPDIVFEERERLHVLGMEYNTVYDPAPTKRAAGTPAASAATTQSPGTASASATGNGAGSTMVTVSGTGTASASTSGTASTTATATAASPPSATADKSTPSAVDPLTGCKQGLCAAILVKLAEPLDPNLVVTVKGLPLKRVRDWRGRGTSVLPPAQSSSDITPPGSTGSSGTSPTKLAAAENSPAASLLEADLPGPNTWMEVDSHRLLLNISKDLAGEGEEFPTIQIVDPAKRALFLPSELDTGFSELIMNGFHFPTRDGAQLGAYLNNHLRRERSATEQDASALHPSGPYPAETFLPLFLPHRDDQPIYAYLGETGMQILIGMENDKPECAMAGASQKPKCWLAGKTQAVLEDRYLDLAWSLSCYLQEPMLVCDVPREQIRDAYKLVQTVCNEPLSDCPALSNTISDYPSISTLQVSVEQYDPDGDDSFYSATPARLGRFPVQRDAGSGAGPAVGYSPWHFESASPDWVKLTGCKYPEFPENDTQLITILGRNIPRTFRTQVLQTSGVEEGCKWFAIPTSALTNPQVVIEYPHSQSNPDVSAFSPDIPPTAPPSADRCVTNHAASAPCAPESLATSLFQPDLDSPFAISHLALPGGNTSTVDSWTVDIPIRHVDCDDTLSLPDAYTKFNATWKIGSARVPIREITEVLPPRQPGDKPCHGRLVQVANQADKDETDLASASTAATNNEKTARAKAAESAAKAKAAPDAEKAADEAQAKADATAAANAADDAKTKAAAAAKAKTDADTAHQNLMNAPNNAAINAWDDASRTGQIILELVVKRSDLRDFPLKQKIQVLRGPLLSSVGKLPELGPSILPTTLSIVNVGTNQFTLQGKNAGVIDAVTVQGPDGTVSTIQTVPGAQIAIVTLTDSKAPAKSSSSDNPAIAGFSEDSVPGGTMIEIQGTNFGTEPGSVSFGGVPADVGTNCWSSKSITVDVPTGTPIGPLTVSVEVTVKGKKYKATKKFIVAGKPLNRVEPLTCPASNPDTQASGKDSASPSGPKAGSYSIVPLIALSKDAGEKVVEYMPLDVVDPNGKPLSFTVAEQKAASTPKGVDSPTTTLTISKKTTVTPAPSASSPAPSQ